MENLARENFPPFKNKEWRRKCVSKASVWHEEGRAKGWPGLSEEVTEICKQLDIPDVNDVLITKASLKKAIIYHHGKEVKKEMEGLEESQKLYSIKQDDFSEFQEYFKEKSVERV